MRGFITVIVVPWITDQAHFIFCCGEEMESSIVKTIVLAKQSYLGVADYD